MALLDPDLARLWVAAGALPRDLRRVVLVAGGRGDAQPQAARGSAGGAFRGRAAPGGETTPGTVGAGAGSAGGPAIGGTGGWDADTHTVPTLVAALAGVVRIERPGGRPLDLAAGEAALIAPGTRHRHAPLRPGCAGYSQGFMLGRSDIELAVPDRTWLLAIPELPARTLLERACLPASGERERLGLVRDALAVLAVGSAQPVAPMPAAVERMWMFLRRERLSPIDVGAVLRASGLGPTRAHLLFRAYFAETPHQLLTRHRLEYARHLLARGEGVAAVAAACGFRSRRHFTAAFRAAHRASPRQWQGRVAPEPV